MMTKSKSHFYFSILCLVLFFSCKKNKIEISQVLPVVGLYEGRITYCNNELLLETLLKPSDGTPVMDMMGNPIKISNGPYTRRVKVYSLDNYLKNGGDEQAITDSLGIAKIRGNKSHTLIIETQWFCLESGYLESMVSMSCMDTTKAYRDFPVAVEVGKIKDQTNPFQMKSENTPGAGKFPCLDLKEFKGYHINGSLQLDYKIGDLHYTMVCQKN